MLNVTITEEGEKLKERALEIPAKISQCTALEPEEAMQLYAILKKLLVTF